MAAGGYVLSESDGEAAVVLIATGSEVEIAVAAQQTLAGKGIAARVVSMPSVEWFDEQTQEYRDSVLPGHPARGGRSRYRDAVVPVRAVRRPDRLARALRRVGRVHGALREVRHHRRGRRVGRRTRNRQVITRNQENRRDPEREARRTVRRRGIGVAR